MVDPFYATEDTNKVQFINKVFRNNTDNSVVSNLNIALSNNKYISIHYFLFIWGRVAGAAA